MKNGDLAHLRNSAPGPGSIPRTKEKGGGGRGKEKEEREREEERELCMFNKLKPSTTHFAAEHLRHRVS